MLTAACALRLRSCPNLNNGQPKQLLPVYDGAATWNPSPANVTNLTLVSVNSGTPPVPPSPPLPSRRH